VLWRAVEAHQVDVVDACLTANADLNLGLGVKNDGSAAHLALETNQEAMCLRFLEVAPGILGEKVDAHGRTVLLRALEMGYLNAARACLQHGHSVEATDQLSGKGVLHAAVRSGKASILDELLKAGAPVDQKDRTGQTPLMQAATAGDAKALAIFLEAGARPAMAAGGEEALAVVLAGLSEEALWLIDASPTTTLADLQRLSAGRDFQDACEQFSGGRRYSTAVAKVQSHQSVLTLACPVVGSQADLPQDLGSEERIAAEAVTERSRRVATKHLAALLAFPLQQGAELERLANSFVSWAASATSPAERKARATLLELLPLALSVAESRSGLASQLLGAGIPEATVEEFKYHPTFMGPPSLRQESLLTQARGDSKASKQSDSSNRKGRDKLQKSDSLSDGLSDQG